MILTFDIFTFKQNCLQIQRRKEQKQSAFLVDANTEATDAKLLRFLTELRMFTLMQVQT